MLIYDSNTDTTTLEFSNKLMAARAFLAMYEELEKAFKDLKGKEQEKRIVEIAKRYQTWHELYISTNRQIDGLKDTFSHAQSIEHENIEKRGWHPDFNPYIDVKKLKILKVK